MHVVQPLSLVQIRLPSIIGFEFALPDAQDIDGFCLTTSQAHRLTGSFAYAAQDSEGGQTHRGGRQGDSKGGFRTFRT